MTVIILRLRQQLFFLSLSVYCCITHSRILKIAAIGLTAFVPVLLAVVFNLLPESICICLMVFQHEWGGTSSEAGDGEWLFLGFLWLQFFFPGRRQDHRLLTVEPTFHFSICLVLILSWSAFRTGSGKSLNRAKYQFLESKRSKLLSCHARNKKFCLSLLQQHPTLKSLLNLLEFRSDSNPFAFTTIQMLYPPIPTRNLTIQKISKQQGPKSTAVHFPRRKKRSYSVFYVETVLHPVVTEVTERKMQPDYSFVKLK